jgi:hypothetical protein
MAFVIADRVRETSTTTGTGNFTLAGAVTGYQTFDAALDTGDTTYYTITDQSGANWEVGIGTFTSPSTLARTTILSSSNGGSVVTFTSGTKDVFISLPASKTVQSFSAGSTGLTPSTASFGAVALAGTLVPANGGTGTSTAFTAGSVVFAGASGVYAQDNASLFFDDTNNRLGIGTASPDAALTVNTVASFGAGAAALPSIAAKGDLNTGMWFPAADTIAASTGGSERLRIDSSGNVGIGTSSPSALLHVNGNSKFGALVTTGLGVSTGDAGLEVGGERSGNGNSIIDLHAAAGTDFSARLLRTSGANGQFEITNSGTGALAFATSSTERMRIDSSGKVGIGTSNPGARLQVDTATTDDGISITNTSSANTTAKQPRLLFRGTDTLATGKDAASLVVVPADVNYVGASLAFYTRGSDTNAERMRIDSSGNIIAGASAALATTATNGFLYVPTCAGTPTGTPTAVTGMAPIVVNTTNNKLYFYSGGAWRDAGP